VPDLCFAVTGAAALPHAAVPQVSFTLEVAAQDASLRVHSGLLRCQIQIEAPRRSYDAEEQARLRDLFGEPERWSTTVRPLLWTLTTVTLPQFTGHERVEMTVPCSFDFNVAATKYFDGLAAGDVPLCFLFSGTVFYESEDSGLQVAPIPWDREARFRLPVAVWRDLMDHYYPNGVWLRLRRDAFDRLAAFKRDAAIPTWEEALERLLPDSHPLVRS
jgi:hypothetical protein